MGPIPYDLVRTTVADLRHTAHAANRGRLSRFVRRDAANAAAAAR